MGRAVKFGVVIRLLNEYKKEYGHCNVPAGYKTMSGIPLGTIVSNIRCGSRKTTFEQKEELDAIGFIWKFREITPFDEVFRFLGEYKKEYGDCNVPQDYKTMSGIPLGTIVSNIRSGTRKTTSEQKEKLDAIGFVWKVFEIKPFNEVLRLIKEYKKEYGDCNVRQDYQTTSGIFLGTIVKDIRYGARKITPEQKEELDAIGFVW